MIGFCGIQPPTFIHILQPAHPAGHGAAIAVTVGGSTILITKMGGELTRGTGP